MRDARLCPAWTRRMGASATAWRVASTTTPCWTRLARSSIRTKPPGSRGLPGPTRTEPAPRSSGSSMPPGRRIWSRLFPHSRGDGRATRGRGSARGGTGWMTHAIASIGIVALIGVAFQSALLQTGRPHHPAGPDRDDHAGATCVDAGSTSTPRRATTAPRPVDKPAPVRRWSYAPADAPRHALSGRDDGDVRVPHPRRLLTIVTTQVDVGLAPVALAGGPGTATWSRIVFDGSRAELIRLAGRRPVRLHGALDARVAERQPVHGHAESQGDRPDDRPKSVTVRRGDPRLVVRTDCAGWRVKPTAADRSPLCCGSAAAVRPHRRHELEIVVVGIGERGDPRASGSPVVGLADDDCPWP